jgi:hypothetical protein
MGSPGGGHPSYSFFFFFFFRFNEIKQYITCKELDK